MQLTSTPWLEPTVGTPWERVSANTTLIGCLWITTFQLCLQSISGRMPLAQRGNSLAERPQETFATLEDSGEKLTLITMADSNRETSSVNLTTFSQLLHAKGDPSKISRLGRKIAKSTLTAYLRKKIDQLYDLEMMLQRKKKIHSLSQNNLPRLARPYFHSDVFKTRWKLSLSYTILINFGFDGKAHILFSNTHWDDSGIEPANTECKIDEIYDPINKKCRLVICDAGYEFIDGFCRSTMGGSSNLNNFTPSPETTPVVADIEDDMTLIILQANVTFADYLTTLTPEFKILMVESLSELLNISADRIKNFTVDIVDDTSQPNRITFHKIQRRLFGMNIGYSNVGDGSYESTSVSENGTNFKTKTETQINRTTEEKNGNSLPDIPLEISFVLVPLNATSIGKSVSTIVQQMDELVQNKEFTFNVNKTSLTVVGLKNEQEPTTLDAWCEHGVKRYYTGDQFSMIDVENRHGGQTTEMIYINETGSLYGTGEFDLTIFVRSDIGKDNANVTAFVFVCDSPKLKDKSCGRISLDNGEYKILPNMSVTFGKHLLGLNEYQRLDDGRIVICIPSTMKSLDFVPKDCSNTNHNLVIAQVALTLIFGVLSLVAMFAVLVTYTLFPKLRNIPGINTMNLTIALFWAELIFLLFGSVDSDVVCTTVAISLHYFFLASFFWMNVMAYDLYCTFGHTNILPWPRSKTKLIPRYLLYAWGAPALIVGACVTIDFSHVFPSVRVGYGMSDTVDLFYTGGNMTNTEPNGTHSFLQDGGPRRLGCWIQDPLASLIAFGVPLICIVLVNAVLFTRTIVSIRKTIKTINLRLSNPVSGKNDVVLYVRMSVVMGFTWFLGLASSFISSGAHPSYSICLLLNVVGLFFVIFNCSQGLFICFVFVLNRRVAGYYKDLWKDLSQKLLRKKMVVAYISGETKNDNTVIKNESRA